MLQCILYQLFLGPTFYKGDAAKIFLANTEKAEPPILHRTFQIDVCLLKAISIVHPKCAEPFLFLFLFFGMVKTQ